MILEQIVADNRPVLEARKHLLPLDDLKRLARAQPRPLDFAAALKGDRVRLIAEVKKTSPSKGIIRADFDPVAIARTYAASGAAAISVLTEGKHFQGSLDYLHSIRKALGKKRPPLLRKDFIHDPYQVYESLAYGADALLLIAAILERPQLKALLDLSHERGMACLVEVHDEKELQTALDSGAKVIGINNRDLKTFAIDLAVTERLRPLIPPDRIVVSESGIKDRRDMDRMAKLGVNAVLVGETLMATPDIGARMRQLL